MQIFEMTTRPDSALLFKRNDPNDIRLGETVKTAPEDYASANYVLLGLPQDEGVRRNKGRVGAKNAPDAIRRCFYKLVEIEGVTLFDLGNTIIQGTLEETHDYHREIVRQVLRDGKKLMVLGGGNDTSYPDCSALAMETEEDVLGFNVDAHFDVRADSPRNSGTPYRQLLEEGHLKGLNFYEMAYQPFANSPTYEKYLREKQAGLYTVDFVQNNNGIASWFDIILRRSIGKFQAIFWGIDMDVVKAGDAPGVSAPNAAGLTAAEFVGIAKFAGRQKESRIFEITEVNPSYDIDERTCRLAAAALWYFLAGYSREQD
jgi:formiminoglutamase